MSSSIPPKPIIDLDEEKPQATDEANLAALMGTAGGANGDANEGGAAPADVYEDDSDDADKNKTVYIFEQQFDNLKAAGFSENAIKKAYASGCISEKTARQWIEMQLDHPELNTDLDASFGRIVIKKKVVLTPEQRVAKIAELKAKIAKKKEESKQQAKDDERAAEKARIAAGKIALEMREEQQARARAQAYIDQKREQEEEAIAKEKIQLGLAIDKLMRKGKTAEEAEAQAKAEFAEARRIREEQTAALMAERRAARAEAANRVLNNVQQKASPTEGGASSSAASGGGGWDFSHILGAEQVQYSADTPAAAPRGEDIEAAEPKDPLPQPNREGFDTLISKMRAANPTGVKATLVMLNTVVANILQHPMDQKKRYLKASNSHYKAKIASTPYALSFLKLLGFQVGWIEVPIDDGNAKKDAVVRTKQEQTVVMNTVIMRRVYAALDALEAAQNV